MALKQDLVLVRYDAACRALSKARVVAQARRIHNIAAAWAAYARQAKNREMQIDAAEIQLRAVRRIGELMAGQRKTRGLAKGGQPYQSTGINSIPVAERAATLDEAGIDKRLAIQARKFEQIGRASCRERV